MEINVFYKVNISTYYRKTGLIRKLVSSALGKFSQKEGVVNIVVVDKKEIHKINSAFLNHDYPTDVISFNYPFPPCGGEGLPFGDVYVCFDVAKKQAALYKQSVLKEFLTYIIHGTLHLAGMDDATPQLRAGMDKKAEEILNKQI
ncbi:putative rRNA maturation factor [Elusimicrobium posterum]|uniref:rRNA maturation RNase YbeY n=1 Tax=Elusimicrobium posterum TaxID=3116653 RepID=UPI003C78EFF1